MRTSRTVTMIAAATIALSACGGGGDADETAPAAADASGTLEVEAGDLYFDPEELSATAGEIEITLVNVGGAEHDFVVEDAGDTHVVHADPGETASGTIELDAGTYTYYCSIPGHRTTMEGSLVVS